MQVTKRREDDVSILDLEGPIDGSDSCRSIHTAMRQELDGDVRKFVLNLSGVEWINSLGIGFLIAASVAAVKGNAQIHIVGPSSRVGAALRASGVVPHVWKEFETEEAARESLK